MNSNLKNIYVVTLLDSLSYGLIQPVLTSHVQRIGGSHFAVGILGTFSCAFQLVTNRLPSYSNRYGKKIMFLVFLTLGAFMNYLLGMTQSYCLVILYRFIFGLVNKTELFCKEFVERGFPKDELDGIYGIMDALNVAGFVIGPVIGGHLYELDNGFFIITNLTVVASLGSIILITRMTSTEITNQDCASTASITPSSLINDAARDVRNSIENLQKISCFNSSLLFVKFLCTVSLTAFFMKYALLLKIRYGASATTIGYTVAYQSIIMFVSNFAIVYKKVLFYSNDSNNSRKIRYGLIGLSSSLLIICFVPVYDLYVLTFIPLAFARTLLDTAWKEFLLLRTSDEQNIKYAADTVTAIAVVVTPTIFGISCDLFGLDAVLFYSIIPIVVATFIPLKSTVLEEISTATSCNTLKED